MGDLERRSGTGLDVPADASLSDLIRAAGAAGDTALVEAVESALTMLAEGRTSQTVVHATTFARAYVYHGEWVADCPRDGCTNVEYVTGKHPRHRGRAGTRGVPYEAYVCTYCGYQAPIEWPLDGEEILRVLERRPVPLNRNWYPAGHRVAVKAGLPHGQTVAELVAENLAHGVK